MPKGGNNWGYGSGGSKSTSSGTNSQGNHWCTRSGDSGGSGYHYSNTDGSYYYSNPDGSTYYNTGDGGSTYTAPNGNSYSK